MNGWVEREARYALSREETVQELVKEADKRARLEMLNWFMQICGNGYTTGMVRKIAYNKYIEISGEGEKA